MFSVSAEHLSGHRGPRWESGCHHGEFRHVLCLPVGRWHCGHRCLVDCGLLVGSRPAALGVGGVT